MCNMTKAFILSPSLPVRHSWPHSALFCHLLHGKKAVSLGRKPFKDIRQCLDCLVGGIGIVHQNNTNRLVFGIVLDIAQDLGGVGVAGGGSAHTFQSIQA